MTIYPFANLSAKKLEKELDNTESCKDTKEVDRYLDLVKEGCQRRRFHGSLKIIPESCRHTFDRR